MRRHGALCTLLFGLNVYLCNDLFVREYIDQTASIEAGGLLIPEA
ncbi:MAG TPA: hypothetical protein VM120_26220 [Bryobacteraceae bacterium]|nr:hypothetical protein [Bryobacteraceae bacterium]